MTYSQSETFDIAVNAKAIRTNWKFADREDASVIAAEKSATFFCTFTW